MNGSSASLRPPVSAAPVGLAFALAFLAPSATVPRLAAQSSDFNSGNDAGWTHYALPAYGAPTYSFPPDDAGGKAYRIVAPPTGDDPGGMGNARAGSFRADVTYTGRLSVGVDLLAWNASWRQESGILYYLANVGLGTSSGYAATYSSGYRNLYISSITGEVDSTVGETGSGSITLEPTHRYRLVVSSHDGNTMLFQVFDKAEPGSAWMSAVCQDSTYSSGVCGVFAFEQTYPSSTEGAEATFDNYVAAVPAAGAMPATVTDLFPPPAGKATAVYPTLSVGILDRDTAVDAGSIVLFLDGVQIPNSSLTIDPQLHKPNNPNSGPKDFNGATVTYPITTLLPWGIKHTNQVVFTDNTGAKHTNTWTWTSAYPFLSASNSLPVGSLNVRGFDVRMVQSENGGANLANSLDRARQQLAVPPQIPVDRSATSIVQTLNWNENGSPASVPGLCAGDYINIAVESSAYLELSAGLHRFRINTDDRAGLYATLNPADANPMVLWESPDNTANTTFDVVVEAAGLYPVRCLWEETAGGALLALSSVDLNDLSEVPVNDPGNPAGVVKAWYPMVCKASSSVVGPYEAAPGAVNTLKTADVVASDCSPSVVGQMMTGGTFTVPLSGTTQFYSLEGPRKTKITSYEKSGSNLVIQYQVQ